MRPHLRRLFLILMLALAACGGTERDLPQPLAVVNSSTTTTPLPTTIPLETSTTAAEPPPTVATESAAPSATSADGRCATAALAVEEAGVRTAPGFEFRCPADARDENGDPHWGITCWHWAGMCDQAPYIEINTDKIGRSDARLRYVIAHERCHSNEIVATGNTTEASADACATAIGFARQAPVYDFVENVIYGIVFLAALGLLVLVIRALRTPPRRDDPPPLDAEGHLRAWWRDRERFRRKE